MDAFVRTIERGGLRGDIEPTEAVRCWRVLDRDSIPSVKMSWFLSYVKPIPEPFIRPRENSTRPGARTMPSDSRTWRDRS